MQRKVFSQEESVKSSPRLCVAARLSYNANMNINNLTIENHTKKAGLALIALILLFSFSFSIYAGTKTHGGGGQTINSIPFGDNERLITAKKILLEQIKITTYNQKFKDAFIQELNSVTFQFTVEKITLGIYRHQGDYTDWLSLAAFTTLIPGDPITFTELINDENLDSFQIAHIIAQEVPHHILPNLHDTDEIFINALGASIIQANCQLSEEQFLKKYRIKKTTSKEITNLQLQIFQIFGNKYNYLNKFSNHKNEPKSLLKSEEFIPVEIDYQKMGFIHSFGVQGFLFSPEECLYHDSDHYDWCSYERNEIPRYLTDKQEIDYKNGNKLGKKYIAGLLKTINKTPLGRNTSLPEYYTDGFVIGFSTSTPLNIITLFDAGMDGDPGQNRAFRNDPALKLGVKDGRKIKSLLLKDMKVNPKNYKIPEQLLFPIMGIRTPSQFYLLMQEELSSDGKITINGKTFTPDEGITTFEIGKKAIDNLYKSLSIKFFL